MKKSKRDRIKREWIEFHKKDRRDDALIFRDNDDELFTEAAKGGGASNIGDMQTTQKSDNQAGMHRAGAAGRRNQQIQ